MAVTARKPAAQKPVQTERDDLAQGWLLAPEPERSKRPAAIPALPTSHPLTTAEIDDGWFLPEEPKVSAPALLDLNEATAAQLQELPGIGRLRASRILATRERLGGFATMNDLAKVQGMGRKTIDALRAHATVTTV